MEFIPKFQLQLFNDGNEEVEEVEEVVDEVDTSVDEVDETEPTESEFELDYTYNGEEGKWTDPEEVRTLAQKGMNYDKIHTKVEEYEKQLEELKGIKDDPLYSWANEYMKNSGYDDKKEFLDAIKVNQMSKKYTENGMSPEQARKEAERDYQIESLKERLNEKESQEKEEKEMQDFISWHQSKLKDGVFSEELNADNIPKEVWEAVSDGQSLKAAYMEHALSNLKVKTEQETIKKLEENKQTSTGSTQDKSQESSSTKWSRDYVEKMVDKNGEEWVDENFDKIVSSGYFGK